MNEPLASVALTEHHRSTGRTTHTILENGKRSVAPPPAALRIDRWENGFILQYLDAHGSVQAHLHRSTVSEAIEQAELEFGVAPSEWQRVEECLIPVGGRWDHHLPRRALRLVGEGRGRR